MITADLRDERIPATKQAFRPTSLPAGTLGCNSDAFLPPNLSQKYLVVVDCSAATTNVFNSFLPADVVLCWWTPLSSVPKAFSRVLAINALVHNVQWSTCIELFQATTAQLPVSSFNCPKLFRDGLHVRSVATARFFDTMKRISKRFCPNLPRWQKSANACPRLYLLPAIKRSGSARNLCETEKVD